MTLNTIISTSTFISICIGYWFLYIKADKLKNLIEYEKSLLDRVNLYHFQLMEGKINQIDDYKRLLNMLCQLDKLDQITVNRASLHVHEVLDQLSNNFADTFKMTPEQYRQRKNMIEFKNALGDIQASNIFSVN